MKEHNEWVSEKWENVEVRYRVCLLLCLARAIMIKQKSSGRDISDIKGGKSWMIKKNRTIEIPVIYLSKIFL
jgi:hypothetical protein